MPFLYWNCLHGATPCDPRLTSQREKINYKGHLWYSKWGFQGLSRKPFYVNSISLNFPGGGVSWPHNPPSDPRMGSMQYNAFCTLRSIIVYQLLLTEFLNFMQLVYYRFYMFSMKIHFFICFTKFAFLYYQTSTHNHAKAFRLCS